MRTSTTFRLNYCNRATRMSDCTAACAHQVSSTHHEPLHSARSCFPPHWQRYARPQTQTAARFQRQQLAAPVSTCSSCERCSPACPLAYLSAPCFPACPRATHWRMAHCSIALAGRAPAMTAGCPLARLRWQLGRRRRWHSRLRSRSRSGLFRSCARAETFCPWVQLSPRRRRTRYRKFCAGGREQRGERAGLSR